MKSHKEAIISNNTLKTLNNQIKAIEDALKKLPHKKLRCKNNGKHIQWYVAGKGPGIYIKKKAREYAVQLAYHTFYSDYINALKNQKASLISYLENQEATEKILYEYLRGNKGFAELLQLDYSTSDEKINTWLNTPFESDIIKPEGRKFETLDGHFVRSKSEVMIADALYENKIPYKYECPIILNNKTFHPDFTIMRPSDYQIIYWEHFGLMDDFNYRENALKKISVFTENGILPSDNFITSFETSESPLSSAKIRKLITMYGLSS